MDFSNNPVTYVSVHILIEITVASNGIQIEFKLAVH